MDPSSTTSPTAVCEKDNHVQKEIHAFSSSRNQKVKFTANVNYSFSKDASIQDKKEALEGFLDGLQLTFQHQLGRSYRSYREVYREVDHIEK